MDIDSWTKWVTLGGAMIAAGSGVWSLKLQIQGKRDDYRVRMNTMRPGWTTQRFMHVVSRCDHPIQLADYGFIDAWGKIHSIIEKSDFNPLFANDLVERGSTRLESRGAHFEVGYECDTVVMGCYARTNLETRPRMTFVSSSFWIMRLWVRLKVLRKGERYLR